MGSIAYRDKMVREGDRAEWTVTLGKSGKVIRARIGGEAGPTVEKPAGRMVSLAGVNLNVGSIAAMGWAAEIRTRTKNSSGVSC